MNGSNALTRVSRIALVAVVALTLTAVGGASAAQYKLVRKADRSKFAFRTKNDKVIAISMQSRFRCEDSSKGITGLQLGHGNQQASVRLPIRSDGTFRYKWRTNLGGSRQVKLKGRVLKNRIRGRWSTIFYDEQNQTTCWTGKSEKSPWVRFSATRINPPISLGRG
jgi:hypothetical protein